MYFVLKIRIKMNILSLFDGMSCGQIALNRIGITEYTYYASEIDKYAIQVTQANYPNTIQLGDVTKYKEWNLDWSSIDLVSGGFPCQAWSLAGKQLGDKDERGMLFWTMLEIIKKVLNANPKAKFLMENVKMKKEFEQYITLHTEQALGKVEKHLINSSLVSAQNRQRYYWTNIEKIDTLLDRNIHLADIVEDGFTDRTKAYCIDANYSNIKQYITKCRRQIVFKDKSQTILATIYKENAKSMIKRNKNGLLVADGIKFRKLSVLECKRLQTISDDYLMPVSDTQAYKMLGNGWTVDVIAHILKGIK
jgi:DNA (cytosine-5)-methyltransferase 1/DNA (cytosine-5)-methyltransferase 3A